jgi:hypothetical protein
MKEHRWTFWARDERGKRHRGIVSYGDDVPDGPPEPPAEFRIALLATPASIEHAPGATAICVPKLARDAAFVDSATPPPRIAAEIAALKQSMLPRASHAQYEAGHVVLPGGRLDAAKVFTRGRESVELERLALVLVDQARAEAIAPYIAVIRHELKLKSGGNALLALEARLTPADASERPPARAPGIVRLRSALRQLKEGALPALALEALTADLRFLRLFEREEHILRHDALDNLLADVMVGAPPPKSTRRRPAPILPIRPRGDA